MSCLFIFMQLSCLLLRSGVGAGRSALPEQDEIALERELRMLNKPYVRSFKIRPSSESTWASPSTAGERIRVHPQESCPEGTVLIWRTLKQDLVNASVYLPRFRPQNDQSSIPGQHFAQLLVDSVEGSKFQAASAIVEVETVTVPSGQVSSAQILLLDDSFNIIQAGWSADPELLGDSQSRFMTSWTALKEMHFSTVALEVHRRLSMQNP